MPPALLAVHSGALLPACGMVAVTAGAWAALYVQRFSEMARRRIDPQLLQTRAGAKNVLTSTNCADNFQNALEIPVLFYALCIGTAVAYPRSVPLPDGFVSSAWLFVALRGAHTLVHCTFNHVTTRFGLYAASTLLLFKMWGDFALALRDSA